MLQVMHHGFIHGIGAAGDRFQCAAPTDDGMQVSQFETMTLYRLFHQVTTIVVLGVYTGKRKRVLPCCAGLLLQTGSATLHKERFWLRCRPRIDCQHTMFFLHLFASVPLHCFQINIKPVVSFA